MAKKDKKTIKSPVIKVKKIAKKSVITNDTPKKTKKGPLAILFAIGGYFKGSWGELRQVRWPNRRSAWGLTLAVLLFTGFFFILIVLLDASFKQLFNFILK